MAVTAAFVLGGMGVGQQATGFDPPVDRAGPITARIEGPPEVTEIGQPIPVAVVLENKAAQPITGTVQLRLIDRWKWRPTRAPNWIRSDGTVEIVGVPLGKQQPAEPLRFEVPGRASTRLEFEITAEQPTYSAHYPIHAHVRFQHGGQEHLAHPILIFQTKLHQPPRPSRSLPWVLQPVPAGGELALDQLPVYRIVWQVFGQQAQTMPVGWLGVHEPTGTTFHRTRMSLAGQIRTGFGVHPPWKEGQSGTMLIELPLQLPAEKPLVFRCFLGQIPEGQSDGLTFRVRVLGWEAPEGQFGQVVWEKHLVAKTWQPVEVDLSQFAGQKVRFQLEAHPGPKQDTGWDSAIWADPVLQCGQLPPPVPFPPPNQEGSFVLGHTRCEQAEYQVRVWPGRRGLLDAVIGFGPEHPALSGSSVPAVNKESGSVIGFGWGHPALSGAVNSSSVARTDSRWGLVSFRQSAPGTTDGLLQKDFIYQAEASAQAAQPSGSPQDWLYFRGFQVEVFGGRLDRGRSPILLQEVKGPDRLQDKPEAIWRHRFQSVVGPFTLVGKLWIADGTLRAKFWLEDAPEAKPWQVVRLEDVATGRWSQPVEAVYAGPGNVLRRPGPFRLGFDGHRLSTSFVGMEFARGLALLQAVDLPPTDYQLLPAEGHSSLHVSDEATWTFVLAPDIWQAVRHWRQVNGLRSSDGVPKAAGRFVFDLWHGRYGPSADALQKAFRYGLRHSMVIWHNWQRWGYDYRLPEIYPPNPQFGTLEQMRQLIAVCRQAGVPFALHDNYIDFYPDAEGFSYEQNIAFTEDGRPVRAWFHEARQAQSYRYRADRIEPYLRANLQTIKKELAPTAYFIDVWASIGPYDYWTSDGQFFTKRYTRDTWGRLFAWIRELLGDQAPQISESGHDQLIGYLDGAQANHLRVSPPEGRGYYRWSVWHWPCQDAERTAWFDAAHHDRFILHGAGYPGRYEGGLDERLHGIMSDDYISTEALTGHPAMVPAPFGRDVVRKYWLLGRLGQALALRTIHEVRFARTDGPDGRQGWTPRASLPQADLHRQQVVWAGGGLVWVNRGQSDWAVEGVVLPQYGFLARVPVEGGLVEASICRRDGRIVEMAQSPQELYVNGRMVVGLRPIRVSVEKFQPLHEGRFEMLLRWQADEPIPADYRPFLHFCNADGEIVFQAVHQGGDFSKEHSGVILAKAVGQLPSNLRPGTELEVRAGLYDPQSGRRLWILGLNDGQNRIRLGVLRLVEPAGGEPTKSEAEPGKPSAFELRWTPLPAEEDPVLARQNPEAKPIDFGALVTAGGVRLHPEGQALVVTPLPDADRPFDLLIRWPKLPWKLPLPQVLEHLDIEGRVRTSRRLEPAEPKDEIRLHCSPGIFAYRLRPEAASE
ncbi:MAG: hypothetical protein NZ602_05970 [Thermoguttaceae bacterium]|nr:hypothetical protein [Thermoguttaceae bacterium]MDW8038591.1 hypothetical protein [Thermoguttaceae bacterium]